MQYRHKYHMITIEDFEAMPSIHIWLRNGSIAIDSRFDEYFLGDKQLLLSCIEDNIKESDDGEYIDYYKAIKKYKSKN